MGHSMSQGTDDCVCVQGVALLSGASRMVLKTEGGMFDTFDPGLLCTYQSQSCTQQPLASSRSSREAWRRRPSR